MVVHTEGGMQVFENKVLRRIFGPKRDEVTGEWRRLHNKELYALYSSPNIIRVIKSRILTWVGHVARMWARILVGKPEGRRPLKRPRHKWEDNIKMDIQEVRWGGTDWIDLVQDKNKWRALVNAVMNLWVPSNAGNFLTSWGPVSFSRNPLLHVVVVVVVVVVVAVVVVVVVVAVAAI